MQERLFLSRSPFLSDDYVKGTSILISLPELFLSVTPSLLQSNQPSIHPSDLHSRYKDGPRTRSPPSQLNAFQIFAHTLLGSKNRRARSECLLRSTTFLSSSTMNNDTRCSIWTRKWSEVLLPACRSLRPPPAISENKRRRLTTTALLAFFPILRSSVLGTKLSPFCQAHFVSLPSI